MISTKKAYYALSGLVLIGVVTLGYAWAAGYFNKSNTVEFLNTSRIFEKENIEELYKEYSLKFEKEDYKLNETSFVIIFKGLHYICSCLVDEDYKVIFNREDDAENFNTFEGKPLNSPNSVLKEDAEVKGSKKSKEEAVEVIGTKNEENVVKEKTKLALESYDDINENKQKDQNLINEKVEGQKIVLEEVDENKQEDQNVVNEKVDEQKIVSEEVEVNKKEEQNVVNEKVDEQKIESEKVEENIQKDQNGVKEKVEGQKIESEEVEENKQKDKNVGSKGTPSSPENVDDKSKRNKSKSKLSGKVKKARNQVSKFVEDFFTHKENFKTFLETDSIFKHFKMQKGALLVDDSLENVINKYDDILSKLHSEDNAKNYLKEMVFNDLSQKKWKKEKMMYSTLDIVFAGWYLFFN